MKIKNKKFQRLHTTEFDRNTVLFLSINDFFTGGDVQNFLGLNHSGGISGRTGQILNAVPPAVDHGHNVAEVQTFHHHLHKVLVAASTGHKLLQGEFAC